MSSEPEFDDQPLPVNLHFRDERALTVDIDAIVHSGRRMRRNRKALAGAVAAAVIGVVGASAAYLAPSSSSSTPVVSAAPSAGPRQSPNNLDEVLAGGGHVTIVGSWPSPTAGYTRSAVAWRAGPQICYGTADLAGNLISSMTTCANRPSALSATTPTILAPHVISSVKGDPGAQAAIGFVSGDVAKISLKIRGHRYDATVVAIPGSPATGAYAVWIDPKDLLGTSARDFTQITGYDSQGTVVATA